MKIMEGSIYTVDDVSDLLGIPRPTLYRYLREYSIPHLRQGGRIRIPEDSFDRIREARDLHKEGLGTATVRRQLREGGPDTGELDRRLNMLHDTLEDLRGDLRTRPPTGEAALSPALQIILARQSLMLSAMFNLTGMVEDLLLNNGKARKRSVQRLEEGPMPTPLPLRSEEQGRLPATLVAEPVEVREAEAPAIASSDQRHPPTRFGSLGRRRRRGAVAVLSALLLGLLLVFFLPKANEGETAASGGPASDGASEQQRPHNGRPDGAGADKAEEGAGNQADVGEGDAAPPRAEATSAEQSTRDTGARVPDVSGSSLEEAANTLSEAGYAVAAIRTVRSQEEPGTVTGTEFPGGSGTRPGAPVVLTVSAGPPGVSSAAAASASASAASISSAGASASVSAPASPSP